MTLDATHNPLAMSWVASANEPGCDFPIQNLPYGRFRLSRTQEWRAGVAIGDDVLDLQEAGLTESADIREVMRLPASERLALRHALFEGLAQGSARQHYWEMALFVQSEVELGLPCEPGDFTRFCTSTQHAQAIGQWLEADAPLPPQYPWLPAGQHGRVASLGVSGQSFRRPHGQAAAGGDNAPQLRASQRMDFGMEVALWIAHGNRPGEPIPMAQADDAIWGLTLLNSWAARDLQAWECQTLGVFASMNFATTVSPWLVTLDALAPFRCKPVRPTGFPPPLPYLDSPSNRSCGALDIQLELWLQTAQMQADGEPGQLLSQSGLLDACWTPAQLVTQHTVNGCPLRAGDVLSTGTLSGPHHNEGGSLLELSVCGSQGLALHNGEWRTFLEDGDTVILKGYGVSAGARRIGFGECRGTLLAAHA
jgi:fumarylacetoacetase